MEVIVIYFVIFECRIENNVFRQKGSKHTRDL